MNDKQNVDVINLVSSDISHADLVEMTTASDLKFFPLNLPQGQIFLLGNDTSLNSDTWNGNPEEGATQDLAVYEDNSQLPYFYPQDGGDIGMLIAPSLDANCSQPLGYDSRFQISNVYTVPHAPKWSAEKTLLLLRLVKHFARDLSKGREKSKGSIWKAIAKAMAPAYQDVDKDLCYKKWSNMLRTFRIFKRRRDKTWPYYAEVEKLSNAIEMNSIRGRKRSSVSSGHAKVGVRMFWEKTNEIQERMYVCRRNFELEAQKLQEQADDYLKDILTLLETRFCDTEDSKEVIGNEASLVFENIEIVPDVNLVQPSPVSANGLCLALIQSKNNYSDSSKSNATMEFSLNVVNPTENNYSQFFPSQPVGSSINLNPGENLHQGTHMIYEKISDVATNENPTPNVLVNPQNPVLIGNEVEIPPDLPSEICYPALAGSEQKHPQMLMEQRELSHNPFPNIGQGQLDESHIDQIPSAQEKVQILQIIQQSFDHGGVFQSTAEDPSCSATFANITPGTHQLSPALRGTQEGPEFNSVEVPSTSDELISNSQIIFCPISSDINITEGNLTTLEQLHLPPNNSSTNSISAVDTTQIHFQESSPEYKITEENYDQLGQDGTTISLQLIPGAEENCYQLVVCPPQSEESHTINPENQLPAISPTCQVINIDARDNNNQQVNELLEIFMKISSN